MLDYGTKWASQRTSNCSWIKWWDGRMEPADETGKGRRRQSWQDLGMLKSLVFITRTMGGDLMVI